MHQDDLKTFEKKAYASYFQDGLIDLFAGFSFVLYGLMMIFEKHAMIGLAFLPVLLIYPMKKVHTLPRMGMVKFSKKRELFISRTALISLGLGAIVFTVLFLFSDYSALENYRLFFLGFSISFLPLSGALLTGVFRYLLYAPLLSSVFILERYMPGSYPYNMTFLGMLITFIGMIRFVRFLHQYPVSRQETP